MGEGVGTLGHFSTLKVYYLQPGEGKSVISTFFSETAHAFTRKTPGSSFHTRARENGRVISAHDERVNLAPL